MLGRDLACLPERGNPCQFENRGGGDLHNLDAFLVFWALITGSLIVGAYTPEKSAENTPPLKAESFGWLLFSLSRCFLRLMQSTMGLFARKTNGRRTLDLCGSRCTLRDRPGEILFISDRQLVTFGELHSIQMEPEYEKVFLMEMAMGNNRPYLQGFYQKLETHSSGAIITDTSSYQAAYQR